MTEKRIIEPIVEDRQFSESSIKEKISTYRKGIMEARERKAALVAELEDVNLSITRTEGAFMALSKLLEDNNAPRVEPLEP